MHEHSAAALLQGAAQRLHTYNPVTELGDMLDESVEPVFDEGTAGTLGFDLTPGGPHASPGDRLSQATSAARRMTARHFGRDALHWLDGHLEVADGLRGGAWGASLGSRFGHDGALESAVHLEWGPQLMESLPAPLHRVVQLVLECLPGLRPAFSTVRAGRRGGTQQVTFEIPQVLPLSRLRPLMERLGLGRQHASLVSAVALLLGARYTLPPDAGMLTVRVSRSGVELRLDIDLDAIPDPPPEITRLLQLQMSERPRSLRAFHRWVAALTPEGYEGPGRLSVLSVVVREDLPARLALHLCPAVIERPRRRPRIRDDVPAEAWLP